MKLNKLFLIGIFTLSFVFISCSDDNNSDNVDFNIPLTDGSFWVYRVTGQDFVTRDSLYVANDTIINSNTYKKMKTREVQPAGFYSASLRNNGLRKSNNKLLLSGNLSISGDLQLPINVDLNLSDFVIFDANASLNQQLGSKNGVIQENFNGIPLTINYNLKAIAGESFPTFTSPNGEQYPNVKSVVFRLNVSISTTQPGIPLPIPVLSSQDVIVSTQYIAEGIGMVHANTIYSYSINSIIAGEIGIPESSSQVQQEFLISYQIN